MVNSHFETYCDKRFGNFWKTFFIWLQRKSKRMKLYVCFVFLHLYPTVTGGSSTSGNILDGDSSSAWRLCDFQFQISRCCVKSCSGNLLLVWISPSRVKRREAACPSTLPRDEGAGWTSHQTLTTRPRFRHVNLKLRYLENGKRKLKFGIASF